MTIKEYILDLIESQKFYGLYDKIELHGCYTNVFHTLSCLSLDDRLEFDKKYRVCFGLVENTDTDIPTACRHCFIINIETNKVVDVTAMKWDDLTEDKYVYYIFKELKLNEYMDNVLDSSDRTADCKHFYKEEVELVNTLLKEGKDINPIYLTSLIEFIYKGDIFKGFSDYKTKRELSILI